MAALVHAAPAIWRLLGIRKGVPFTPFPSQLELLQALPVPWLGYFDDPVTGADTPYPSIFGVNCGRRFSKTTCAEIKCWEAFTAPEDIFGPPTVRVTADTFEHGQKIWDRFVWHMENTELSNLIESYNRTRFLITGKRGETIQLLSADNPQALAGDGVTTWVIDEAQYLSYPAYENLVPSTAERDGQIFMFGVAEGTGPFREVCFKGDRTSEYPEFKRLHYPTSSNPFVPRRRIEQAKRMYTPSRFRQLYEAEWDDDTGKIIKGARSCIVPGQATAHPNGWAEFKAPIPGHVYFGGMDLASHSDWYIYVIADRDGNVVAWDRFNRTSWEILKHRARLLHDRYFSPRTFVDSTGSGDPVYDDLLRRGLNVEGYQIGTNARKRMLVDELAIRIGSRHITYPENRVMLGELENFETHVTLSGVVQYQAPAGQHDDWVIALAMLCQALPHRLSARTEDWLASGHDDLRQYSAADDITHEDLERELDRLELPGLDINAHRQFSSADY